MALTGEQMAAAVAAQRMLADPQFQSVLNSIVESAAERALFLSTEQDRETYRQRVLAIAHIRQELTARAEMPAAEEMRENMARSME